jgi:hypothetical protein
MTPGLQKMVRKGQTKNSVLLRVVNQISMVPQTSLPETSFTIRYWRHGQGFEVSLAPVSITDLSAAHNPGGIKHVVDGIYRVDVPDAAFVKGADGVVITGAHPANLVFPCLIQLIDGGETPFAATPQVY